MNRNPLPVLVEFTRGPVVESVHSGAVAVVDAAGKLVASYGDPQTITFLRSSSKPLQVLPFIEAGGLEAYRVSDRELAIMCASHSGTDEHVEVVRRLQARIGVSEDNLLCGSHPPSHTPTAHALISRGEQPTPIRHNCSGKHTGFLAYALLRGDAIEDYIAFDHPIQRQIIQTFAEMTGVLEDEVALGVDGCSAPVFAIPLYNAALAFARLADPTGLSAVRANACRRVTQAMAAHPDMVAGPGRFDTLLMGIGKGLIVSKGGAEGYQVISLLPGALHPSSPALGIAIKIADGDVTGRAVPLVAIETLRQLGAITEEQIPALAPHGPRPVLNWRKLEVGQVRPVFTLQMA